MLVAVSGLGQSLQHVARFLMRMWTMELQLSVWELVISSSAAGALWGAFHFLRHRSRTALSVASIAIIAVLWATSWGLVGPQRETVLLLQGGTAGVAWFVATFVTNRMLMRVMRD